MFRTRDAITLGLLTPSEVRSRAWRRLYRGVYADAELPDTFGLRIAGAALLIPSAAVFSGRTAAYLHGATDLVEVSTPVEVSVPPPVRYGPVSGLRIRSVAVPQGDVVSIRGRRCTSGLRTALDIARVEPLVEAVVALDVLLARAVVGRGELCETAAAVPAGRGARKAQRAVGLTDHRAESPPESRLRVILTLAGLPPEPQFVVRHGGEFMARVDLGYPSQRVAVEYDGGWHAEPGQFARDRRRLNRLVAAGWTVLHVTAADLRDPDALIARIRAILAGRNFGEGAP